MKKCLGILLVGLVALALGGCPRPFRVPEPGPDYALITDSVSDVRAGRFVYTVLEMDGRPVKREIVPFGVDLRARTVAPAGEHTFKVRFFPSGWPAAVQEATFVAYVRGGTTYFVGTRDELPVLMEFGKVTRKAPSQ